MSSQSVNLLRKSLLCFWMTKCDRNFGWASSISLPTQLTYMYVSDGFSGFTANFSESLCRQLLNICALLMVCLQWSCTLYGCGYGTRISPVKPLARRLLLKVPISISKLTAAVVPYMCVYVCGTVTNPLKMWTASAAPPFSLQLLQSVYCVIPGGIVIWERILPS